MLLLVDAVTVAVLTGAAVAETVGGTGVEVPEVGVFAIDGVSVTGEDVPGSIGAENVSGAE